MKAVVQRVLEAEVVVEGCAVGKIGPGLLTLLGIEAGDTEEDLARLVEKILKLRIFDDAGGKMNLSLLDTRGSHLIVSQFTLCGDTSRGNRPSFLTAARPEAAKPLYEKALEVSRLAGVLTEGGQFQTDMKVRLVNDGPVTLILES